MFRGLGLWVGVVIDAGIASAKAIVAELADAGVLTKETHETVIRFAPPLTISRAELDWGLARCAAVFRKAGAASENRGSLIGCRLDSAGTRSETTSRLKTLRKSSRAPCRFFGAAAAKSCMAPLAGRRILAQSVSTSRKRDFETPARSNPWEAHERFRSFSHCGRFDGRRRDRRSGPGQGVEGGPDRHRGRLSPLQQPQRKKELEGYEIDYANLLCEKMKVKCTWVVQDGTGSFRRFLPTNTTSSSPA